MTTGIINFIIDFSRNHPEAFVVLLLSFLGSIFWLLRFICNRYKRLNEIYVVRGKKSSSIDYEKLLMRPFPKYYELDAYQKLKETIKKDTHALVVGAPLSGKTRAIYEVLKTKKPAANVIIPRARNIDSEKFEVPFNLVFWRKKILILDDIDKFIEIKDFKFMVEEFLKNNAIIIASCRSGLEFEKLRCSEWLISLFRPEDIIQFPENISDEKGKEIAKEAGVKWNPSEFDGKIGSLMMPLEIMKNRYTGSSPEEKAILRSIRLLYKTGIYQEKENFSINRILHLCKNLFGKDIDKHKFDEISPDLVKKNFIKIINDNVVWAEEAYLDFVIEAVPVESDRIDLFDTIKSYFLGDAEALFRLGNRAYGIGTVDINKKYYMKVSIAAYEEALRVYTFDRFPMDYAMIQNNLGTAYQTLAEVENKAENCKKAIAAFKEGLKVRTFDRFPLDYATIQNNLGSAYAILAEVENKAENCKKAIAAFKEGLKVRTFDRIPLDYATIQNNLGNAYQTLAEVENKTENCKKSIAACQEAQKVYTLDRFPLDYAMTQNNLGNAYQTLAEVENKAENCKKSIVVFEGALKVRTLDRFHYTMIQNNLGNAYKTLGEVENKAENCRRAVAAYQEALKVTTLDRFPMQYAMTQNNLGNAYQMLAEVENKVENCRRAVAVYQEALKVTTLDRFPMQYAMTQNNLGNAYRTLAEVENKAENCKKSIAACQEALKVTTLDRFPMQYATTQNHLGNAYKTLAEVENKAENCRRAVAAFEEALKVRTFARFPMDYALTQNNLGATYRILAEAENKAENCKKAIIAFEEALKIFTKDEFPEPYKVISRNLEIAKNFCSQRN